MNNNQLGQAIRGAAAGVEVENVNLSYGTTQVLKNVSLTIQPGEFFAFLGPSGCGKTTLLRLIAGFNIAQTGSIRVGGQDVSALPPWKRDVGMVFQSYALWPHMTVAKNVAFGLEERKLPRDEISARVDQALDIVNLRHLKDRRPSQLSGGQQQRVALARTIAVRPKVLLLDEPLSNLDARMRVQVRRELRDLQQELGITTIFVTHDQEEANTICDRIAVISDGMVRQVGTPMALYDYPDNLFVASFLGTANIIEGVARGGTFEIPSVGSLPIPALEGSAPNGGPASTRIVFRPQSAGLTSAQATAQPGHVILPGIVAEFEFLGPALRYAIRIGEGKILVDVPHQAGGVPMQAGDAVSVELDTRRILVLAA